MAFFGVGNENWGCGGHMTAEVYADQYRRYATYVRNYGAVPPIYKIAGGANSFDYHWTEVLMKQACGQMSGLSFHYYTPGGSTATDFDDGEYYRAIRDAFRMEELVRNHSEIMNRYDPEKRVGLIVDEWGIWHRVEEGTNPGFLYQQNTIRDALIAALSLNIFNKHSDRVRMANIAQTINVLQSVALTDGEEMLLTPTYHVFKMFKDHQENTLLGSYITTPNLGEGYLPKLQESASICEDGTIIATLLNTSLTESAEIRCQVADFALTSLEAEILTGDPHDHNTFEQKDAVKTVKFTDFTPTADGFTTVIPPCSVVKFVIK
jgi:alpha-N-arabinofuranosidase